MKRWKRTAALAAVAAMMLSYSVNVSAAGVRDVFDAEYYADSYADLKASFGYDAEALFRHYMDCGLSEGRSGSKVFNVAEYRSAYTDLEEIFGDDWDAYVNHYCTSGIKEGRTAGVYGRISLNLKVGDGIVLQKGASTDITFNVEGTDKPLHAKVTYVDVAKDFKNSEIRYYDDGRPFLLKAYKFTVKVECEASDWNSIGRIPEVVYGVDCDDAYFVKAEDYSWGFTIKGQPSGSVGNAKVEWSAFDPQSAGFNLCFNVSLPAGYDYLYPKMRFGGSDTEIYFNWSEE